uniref:(northern house mosquito) hypothetical protein n=1 Tax=Culex pipiens TaxID=7175 RepID=A0A8D8C4H1_CULPI
MHFHFYTWSEQEQQRNLTTASRPNTHLLLFPMVFLCFTLHNHHHARENTRGDDDELNLVIQARNLRSSTIDSCRSTFRNKLNKFESASARERQQNRVYTTSTESVGIRHIHAQRWRRRRPMMMMTMMASGTRRWHEVGALCFGWVQG